MQDLSSKKARVLTWFSNELALLLGATVQDTQIWRAYAQPKETAKFVAALEQASVDHLTACRGL